MNCTDILHSPREGGREAAVVDPAGDDVEEVDGAGEVQAQLRPLHNVPQGQGAAATNEMLGSHFRRMEVLAACRYAQ